MIATLRLCAGGGWLARRPDGLFYTTRDWGSEAGEAPPASQAPEVMGAFTDAADAAAAVDAVTASTVEGGFDVPPFVLVTWADQVQCVVFGDVAVQTEDPSAPMLSAAGSSTWVERRLTFGASPIRVWAGEPALTGTVLNDGVVPAGGFDVQMEASAPADHQRPETPIRTDTTDQALEPPAGADQPVATTVPAATGAEARVRGIEALTAATGGDWMEDSLGLGGRRPEAADGSAATSGDESPTGEHQRVETGHGPPGIEDVESTWVPEAAPPIDAGRRASPPAGPSGSSGEAAVAHAVLPDASVVPIVGTVVFGRNPNRAAARVGDDARLVVVDWGNAVSRTHVAMHVHGSTLTATDCGSRGGVVMVTPGREPLMLEPWIPQEVTVGDTLYLGGPKGVRIEPPTPRQDSGP